MADAGHLVEATNKTNGRAVLLVLIIELLTLKVEAKESQSFFMVDLKELFGPIKLEKICHQRKLRILIIYSGFENFPYLFILNLGYLRCFGV